LQFSIFVIPLQVKTINHIEDMNITLLKKTGSKEVINRIELSELAAAIKNGVFKNAVTRTREEYHLIDWRTDR